MSTEYVCGRKNGYTNSMDKVLTMEATSGNGGL